MKSPVFWTSRPIHIPWAYPPKSPTAIVTADEPALLVRGDLY